MRLPIYGMNHPITRLQFWFKDRGLTVLVLLLCFGMFVLEPLSDLGYITRGTSGLVTTMVVIVGLLAMPRTPLLNVTLMLLGGILIGVEWWRYTEPSARSIATHGAMSILFLLLLGGSIMLHVFAHGPVNAHRIQGAVAAYVIIAVIFAHAYAMIDAIVPDAFSINAAPAGESTIGSRALYFSLVTLTSLGYGDITPVHPVAQSLATFEALVGVLYPVLLIGRLVTLELRHTYKMRE